MADNPYRIPLARDAVPPLARLSHGYNHALTVLLIVGMAPAALVAICTTARVYAGPWVMPTTILYPAIGYAAAVLGFCAIDALRRWAARSAARARLN